MDTPNDGYYNYNLSAPKQLNIPSLKILEIFREKVLKINFRQFFRNFIMLDLKFYLCLKFFEGGTITRRPFKILNQIDLTKPIPPRLFCYSNNL
jgi:hypothetical protein